MNVEDRVRRALHADADRLEVPPRPSLEVLERRRRVAPRWAGPAAAAAALAVLVVAVMMLLPSPTVEVLDPPDDVPRGLDDGQTVSFDPDSEDVFATGETEGGLRWVAAARIGALPCIGVSIEANGGKYSAVSCSPRTPVPIQAVRTTINEATAAIGVAGWVSDEVDRVVWELPGGPQEITIRRHGDLPARVFGAAAPLPDSVTMLVAYDSAGRRLGAIGVGDAESFEPGSREESTAAGEVPTGMPTAVLTRLSLSSLR